MASVVYPFATSYTITVPVASKIAIRCAGFAQYALGNTNPALPYSWGTPVNCGYGQIVLGTYTVPTPVQIYAQADPVFYEVNTNPNAAPYIVQKTAVAKTTSATLTALEIWQGILTVNQGAAGASALQLPLATDMDALFTDSIADDGFDFSLINISTVAAEDASITTNTGWTLVGNMDVASNAAATDKSAGRFRARKTAAGAWTLYRLS